MTMVGPEVQVTLTNDVERLQRRLAQLQPKGYINFVAAVHLARVILRNQREKNRKKRIVIFVGSPVCTTPEELTVLATLLKTEKVHVDIVNFGEYVENYGQLTIFTSILNGDGTSSSCLVTVPAGNILSKVVAGSAIVQGEKSQRDPNFYLDFEDDDPAWLLALRVSQAEQLYQEYKDYEYYEDYEACRERAGSAGTDPEASDFASALPEHLPVLPPDVLAKDNVLGTDETDLVLDEALRVSQAEQLYQDYEDYEACRERAGSAGTDPEASGFASALPEHLPVLSPDVLEDVLGTDETDLLLDVDWDVVLGEFSELLDDPDFVLSILASIHGAETQINDQSTPSEVFDDDQGSEAADENEDAEDEQKP
ncbi:26S proteasome non-ATPase regulatory subunit 4 [Rhipicephalus microplus]|uniref:26S proteasome non-ATPase regulatory subunit 4 n=1 Tax=Rhipicephalus microplus TaxID=6941 RepID=UPI003F6ACABC